MIVPRMSPAEIELFLSHVRAARSYLEFGAGGSTLLAVDAVAGHVTSVESDRDWIAKLRAESPIASAEAQGRLHFFHADIGPTGDWGAPKDDTGLRRWAKYYSRPWTARENDYDFVFIDGRFRVACALMTAVVARPGVTVGIHDYGGRMKYHVVGRYYDTVREADSLVILRRRPAIDMPMLMLDMTEHFLDPA